MPDGKHDVVGIFTHELFHGLGFNVATQVWLDHLTTSNGIADYYPLWVGVPDSSSGVLVNTQDAMIDEVRKQIKGGVDTIKIGDSVFGQHQAFSDEEVRVITELAHRLKRRVTIHARGSEAVDAAIKAGVDWIMHGELMTDEVIERLGDRLP